MTEERLTHLAMISIEKDFAYNLNYEDTIATFSSLKQRRLQLTCDTNYYYYYYCDEKNW